MRDFGVVLAAVLLTAGPLCAQQVGAPAASGPATTIDWLSPNSLAWTNPDTFNWATSPIKLNLHEYGSYNNNILNSPSGSVLPPGQTRGDFLLNTTVGGSTRFNAWSQQVFADASYNIINYRHNVGFDGHNYNLDAGVNWIATSRCSGNVTLLTNQHQAAQEDLFGPGIATVRTQAATETGQCGLYQNVSVILNSGITSTNQTVLGSATNAANALDNVNSYVQSGFKYQWADLNNLQLLAKFSNTRYTNRAVVAFADAIHNASLLDARYANYSVVYNRTLSEMFNMSASAGLASISQETVGGRLGSSTPTTPTYSLHAAWLPSPKWTFAVNVNRSVAPPTSILAGVQIGNSESVVATYQWTPKFGLSLTVSRNYLAGAQRLSNTVTQVLGGYGANTFETAMARATYQITPFTSASISMAASQRYYTGGNASGEILLFGLDYQPQ